MKHRFHEHDLVVYEKHKHGSRPGPRAHDVRPALRGDDYDCVVNKFWIVVEARPNERIKLRTPGGKQHVLDPNDPCLRPATLSERLWLRFRNPQRLDALRHAGA